MAPIRLSHVRARNYIVADTSTTAVGKAERNVASWDVVHKQPPCDSAIERLIDSPMRSALSIVGFDICEAGNGEEALMRLRMIDYDVALLDINMPGMGCMETCSQMTASPFAPSCSKSTLPVSSTSFNSLD